MFRAFRTCNEQYRYVLFTSWEVDIVKKKVAARDRRLRQHFQVRDHSFSLHGPPYPTPVNHNIFIFFNSSLSLSSRKGYKTGLEWGAIIERMALSAQDISNRNQLSMCVIFTLNSFLHWHIRTFRLFSFTFKRIAISREAPNRMISLVTTLKSNLTFAFLKSRIFDFCENDVWFDWPSCTNRFSLSLCLSC